MSSPLIPFVVLGLNPTKMTPGRDYLLLNALCTKRDVVLQEYGAEYGRQGKRTLELCRNYFGVLKGLQEGAKPIMGHIGEGPKMVQKGAMPLGSVAT